jgi:hypothetical protein
MEFNSDAHAIVVGRRGFETLKKDKEALLAALKGVTNTLVAVKYSMELGKSQNARLEEALKLIKDIEAR